MNIYFFLLLFSRLFSIYILYIIGSWRLKVELQQLCPEIAFGFSIFSVFFSVSVLESLYLSHSSVLVLYHHSHFYIYRLEPLTFHLVETHRRCPVAMLQHSSKTLTLSLHLPLNLPLMSLQSSYILPNRKNSQYIQNWNSALFRSAQDLLPLNWELPYSSACNSHLRPSFLNKSQDIPFEHFSSAPMQ